MEWNELINKGNKLHQLYFNCPMCGQACKTDEYVIHDRAQYSNCENCGERIKNTCYPFIEKSINKILKKGKKKGKKKEAMLFICKECGQEWETDDKIGDYDFNYSNCENCGKSTLASSKNLPITDGIIPFIPTGGSDTILSKDCF